MKVYLWENCLRGCSYFTYDQFGELMKKILLNSLIYKIKLIFFDIESYKIEIYKS